MDSQGIVELPTLPLLATLATTAGLILLASFIVLSKATSPRKTKDLATKETRATMSTDFSRNGEVSRILEQVRMHISENRSQDALSALFEAVRITDGQEGIMSLMSRANEMWDVNRDRNKAQMVLRNLIQEDSLLSERGFTDILQDAFVDGSSVMCSGCGGLVSIDRMEAHATMWCPALPDSDHEDDGVENEEHKEMEL